MPAAISALGNFRFLKAALAFSILSSHNFGMSIVMTYFGFWFYFSPPGCGAEEGL